MSLTIKRSPLQTEDGTADLPALRQMCDSWFSGKYYWGATLGTSNRNAAGSQVNITADEDTIITALTLGYRGTSTYEHYGDDASNDNRLNMYIFRLDDLVELGWDGSNLKGRVPRASNNKGEPSDVALTKAIGSITKRDFIKNGDVKVPITPQLIKKGETLKLHIHISRTANHSDWLAASGIPASASEDSHFIKYANPTLNISLDDTISVDSNINTLTIKKETETEYVSIQKVLVSIYGTNTQNAIIDSNVKLIKSYTIDKDELNNGPYIIKFKNRELIDSGLTQNYWFAHISVIDNFNYASKEYFTQVVTINKIPNLPTVALNHNKGVVNQISNNEYRVYVPSNGEENQEGLITINTGEDSDSSFKGSLVEIINNATRPPNETGGTLYDYIYTPKYSIKDEIESEKRYYWTWDNYDISENSLTINIIKNDLPVLKENDIIFSTEDSEGIPNGKFRLALTNSPFKQARKARKLQYKVLISEDGIDYKADESVTTEELTYEEINNGISPEIIVNLVENDKEKVTPGQYYKVQVSAFDGVEWSNFVNAHTGVFQTVGKLEYKNGQAEDIILSHSDELPAEANSSYKQYYKNRIFNYSFSAPPRPTAVPPERYMYRIFCNYYEKSGSLISSELALQEENSTKTDWVVSNTAEVGKEVTVKGSFFAPPLFDKNEYSMNATVEFYTLNTSGNEIQKLKSKKTTVEISDGNIANNLRHAWQLEFPSSDSYSLKYKTIDKLRESAFRPNHVNEPGIELSGAIPDSSLDSVDNYKKDLSFSLKYQENYFGIGKQVKSNSDTFNLSWTHTELSGLNYNLIRSLTADLPVVLEVRDLFGNIATKDYTLKIDFRERPKQLKVDDDNNDCELGTTGLSIFNGSLPPKRYETAEDKSLIKSVAYYKPSDFFPKDVKMMSHEALLVKFDYNKIKSYPEQICSKARVQVCQYTNPISDPPIILKDWQEISTLVVGDFYDIKNKKEEVDGESIDTTDYRVLEIPLYNLKNSNTEVSCYLNIEFIDDSLYNSYKTDIKNISSIAYSESITTVSFSYLERPNPKIGLDNDEIATELSFNFSNKFLQFQEGQLDMPVDFITFLQEEFSKVTTSYFKRSMQYFMGEIDKTTNELIYEEYTPTCEYYCDLSIYPNFDKYDTTHIIKYTGNTGEDWSIKTFPDDFKIESKDASLYYFLRGRLIYTEGISWDGFSFQPIIKTIYTDTHTFSDNIATVSYRQNAVGINTVPSDESFFEVKMREANRSHILFSGTSSKKSDSGEEEIYHPSILFDFINKKITFKQTFEDGGSPHPLQLDAALIPIDWIATSKDVAEVFSSAIYLLKT